MSTETTLPEEGESAESRQPQRYLGGESTAKPHRGKIPRSFGFFVLLLSAAVSAIGLYIVVTRPFAEAVAEFDLTMVTTEAQPDSDLPPFYFGKEDAHRLATVASTGVTTAVPQQAMVASDFDRIVYRGITRAKSPTSVIYLAAHSASDSKGAYLLASHSKADNPLSWYPITRVFQSIERALLSGEGNATNVLLIIDTNRVLRHFQTARFSNNFSKLLKQEFARVNREWQSHPILAEKNLTVICSSSPDQESWTSATWQCSPFAATVAYGLGGGVDVNGVTPTYRPAKISDPLSDLDQITNELSAGDRFLIRGIRSSGVPVETEFVFGEEHDGVLVGDLFHQMESVFLGELNVNLDASGVVLAEFRSQHTRTTNPTVEAFSQGPNLKKQIDLRSRLTVTTPDRVDPEIDKSISVAELSTYIENTVLQWSVRNRPTPQLPVVLRFGDNFHVCKVNYEVSMTTVLDSGLDVPKDNDAKTESSETSEPDEGEEKPDPATVAAERREAVTKRIRDLWESQSKFESSNDQFLFPSNWAEMRTALVLADLALAHNDADLADVIASHIAQPPFDKNSTDRDPKLSQSWTFAGIRKQGASANKSEQLQAVAAERKLVDSIIEQPDEGLKRLQHAQSVEACVLRQFLKLRELDSTTFQPALVRRALQLTTLAESIQSPDLELATTIAKELLDRADAVRHTAYEQHLIGRIDRADELYEQAEREYDSLKTQVKAIDSELRDVQIMTAMMPFFVEWAGLLSHEVRGRRAAIQQFRQFVTAVQTFSSAPNRENLTKAYRLGVTLRQLATDFARSSLTPPKYSGLVASLQLPILPLPLRARVVEGLRKFQDSAIVSARTAIPLPSKDTGPTLAFPVSEFLKLVAPANPEFKDNGTFWSRLERLDKGIGEDSSLAIGRTVDARQDLLRVTTVFRDFLVSLRLETPQLNQSRAWWERRMERLALAPWSSGGPRDERNRSPARVLSADQNITYLNRQLNRLEAESRLLAGDPFNHPISTVIRELSRFQVERQPSVQLHSYYIRSEDDGRSLKTRGQSSQVTLDRSPNLSAGRKSWLVMDVTGDGDFRLVVDGMPTNSDHYESSVNSLEPQPTWRVGVETAASATRALLSIRVVTNAGDNADTIDWYQVPINFPPPKRKSARLRVAWDDKGAQTGRIDLFPNQSINITPQVELLADSTAPLSVQVVGDRGSTITIAVNPSPDQAVVPLSLPVGSKLPILSGGLRFRLLEGETVIEDVSIPVAILDPHQCFDRRIHFDPLKQTVRATIVRTHVSDVPDPVPFELQFADNRAESALAQDGRFEFVMKPDQTSGGLNATIPADLPAPYEIAISACGVPRMFRYELSRGNVIGSTIDHLSITPGTSPPPSVLPYRDGVWGIPIPVRIDGSRSVDVVVGLDLNRNGQLESSEIADLYHTWYGREVSVTLTGPPPTPAKAGPVRTTTSTVGAPIPWAVKSAVQDLTAQANLTGRSGRRSIIIRAQDGTSTQRLIYPITVLKRSPDIQIVLPVQASTHAANAPLPVTIQTYPDLADVVSDLEFGFDLNKDGKLDPEKERVLPVGYPENSKVTFDRSPRLIVSIPTENLKQETATLLVRTHATVSDSAEESGHREMLGKYVSRPVTFTDSGTVAGQVVLSDGTPVKLASVQIGTFAKTVSDENGKFEFTKVPPGKHQIAAQTDDRVGVKSVEVTAAQTSRVQVTVFLKN